MNEKFFIGLSGEPTFTLRDYFAAQAINCFSLDDVEVAKITQGNLPQHHFVAKFCYELADAMLKERAEQGGKVRMDETTYWNEMYAAACEQRRPFIQLRPRIYIDGNQWCVLYGDSLQDGVAGFGDSPNLAAWDFDKAWHAKLPVKEQS